MANEALNEVLTDLNEKEEAFQNDNAKVVNFSYTKKAYDENTAAGVESYDFNKEQNIPLGSATVLDTNNTVLGKGFRSQGSSIPRMLMNHFLGRVSYNLNKIHDHVYKLIKALRENLGDYSRFATLDENGRIPYSQLPESAVELKGEWNASTNTTNNEDIPFLIDGTGTNGDFFFCTVEGWFNSATGTGSATEAEGYVHFAVNDRILYNNGIWGKIGGGAVSSVNGKTGAVVLDGNNINATKDGTTDTINNILSNLDSGDAVIDVETLPEETGNKVYREIKKEKVVVEEAGKTWTQSNVTKYSFLTVYYANGIWVAGSGIGIGSEIKAAGLWWSTDGKNWTQSNITDKKVKIVYYAEGLWVAGTTSGLLWSTDGKSWTPSNKTVNEFRTVYYANGIWVAGSMSTGLWWSTDGKSWTQSDMTDEVFRTVYYANGIWVAGSGLSGLCWSTDGKQWTQSYNTSGGFRTVYYANGIWVAGSGLSGLWWSTDGKQWTQSNKTDDGFSTVYYANGIWVAGTGTQHGLFWSPDGKQWTQSNRTNNTFRTVYYANGIWVACSTTAGLFWSTDGKQWTLSNRGEVSHSVYYADNIWVAGGDNATSECAGLLYSESVTETVTKTKVYAKDTELALNNKIPIFSGVKTITPPSNTWVFAGCEITPQESGWYMVLVHISTDTPVGAGTEMYFDVKVWNKTDDVRVPIFGNIYVGWYKAVIESYFSQNILNFPAYLEKGKTYDIFGWHSYSNVYEYELTCWKM